MRRATRGTFQNPVDNKQPFSSGFFLFTVRQAQAFALTREIAVDPTFRDGMRYVSGVLPLRIGTARLTFRVKAKAYLSGDGPKRRKRAENIEQEQGSANRHFSTCGPVAYFSGATRAALLRNYRPQAINVRVGGAGGTDGGRSDSHGGSAPHGRQPGQAGRAGRSGRGHAADAERPPHLQPASGKRLGCHRQAGDPCHRQGGAAGQPQFQRPRGRQP